LMIILLPGKRIYASASLRIVEDFLVLVRALDHSVGEFVVCKPEKRGLAIVVSGIGQKKTRTGPEESTKLLTQIRTQVRRLKKEQAQVWLDPANDLSGVVYAQVGVL
jgi:hypothetical protein